MSDSDFVDRSRMAAGPDRQVYLDGSDIDRVMAIVLALASELASVRERLDSHERLAALGHSPVPKQVEEFRADAAAEAEREVWRDAYIRRIFRVVSEDIERLQSGPPQGG